MGFINQLTTEPHIVSPMCSSIALVTWVPRCPKDQRLPVQASFKAVFSMLSRRKGLASWILGARMGSRLTQCFIYVSGHRLYLDMLAAKTGDCKVISKGFQGIQWDLDSWVGEIEPPQAIGFLGETKH